MPHIHCYLDTPALVWTMFWTDLLIGVAYVLISIILWALLKKIQLQFNFIILCFGVFIAACGGTHLMEVWTLWHPVYWVSAMFKVITAAASVGTGIYLFRLRTPLLKVAEGAKLSEQRRLELERLTQELESRVEERTRDLQRSEERFRHTFERAPVGIAHVSQEGRWLKVNPMICQITGYSQEELFAKTFGDITHPEDLEKDQELARSVWSGEVQSYSMEKRYFHKKGHIVWVMLTVSVSRDEAGRPEYFIACIDDITEKTRVEEELKEAVRARDEFLSIASHELKTPITAMKIQASAMKRGFEKNDPRYFAPERILKMADQSGRSLDRLNHLVDDMLDISRLTSGKLIIQPERINLSVLVHEVVDRYRPQIEAAQCTLTVEAKAEVWGNWDRFRIEQVITNLLTNATRYGANSPILVQVTTEKGFALFTVKDQGIGISKENQERIFQRFERAVSADKISGLGLGLYISKQIVEMHGGTITVESELGRGATFTVKLPYVTESHSTRI